MGDLDFGDCSEVWIPKPVFMESTGSFNPEDTITFNASSVLDGSYYRYSGMYSPYRDLYVPDGIVDKFEWWIKENGYKKEEIPEMKVEENREFGTFNYKYAVACHNYEDLLEKNILKCISIMKAKLMMECMPYHVKNIQCRMSPMVKNNIIMAYRKLSMYGKKTPFVARFDEYGRRLEDEIKIDTMRGMDIKIVDPDVYGQNYLVFETYINKAPLSDDELPF